MNVRYDEWGRPTWGGVDHWPFRVRRMFREDDNTVLEIILPSSFAHSILRALTVFSAFVRQLEHYGECAERAERTDEWLLKRKALISTIQGAYLDYRKSGLLHRAAVRSLCADPRFTSLRWTFADFNRHVSNPSSRSLSSDPVAKQPYRSGLVEPGGLRPRNPQDAQPLSSSSESLRTKPGQKR